MKYIDAEKLKAEIERRKKSIDECPFIEAEFGAEMRREGKTQTYNEILSIITSLQQEQPESGSSEKPNDQQPELDLEKEYKSYMGSRKDDLSGKAVTVNMKDLARHFYELARQKYGK